VDIGGYSIGGYKCSYFINGYRWLLITIILMVIGGYFVGGYNGYSIDHY